MTVRADAEGTIILEGLCPSEEAEVLLRLLLEQPDAAIDWAGCDYAHTAIIQVLLVAKPRLRASARQSFLSRWIEPLLRDR